MFPARKRKTLPWTICSENSAKMPEKAFPMTVQCSADSDKAQKKLFPSLHFYINKAINKANLKFDENGEPIYLDFE